MKKTSFRILQLLVCLSIFLLPCIVQSQSSDFFSRTHFTINTYFLDQKTGPLDNELRDEFQNKLFYSNPYFGVELEYQLFQQISAGIGLNFSRSQVYRNESITYIVAPPPGTISNFYSTYNFNNLLIEPKIAAKTSFYGAEFYWSAGPVFSIAVLNSNTDWATYDEPEIIVESNQSRSSYFNTGVQGATGFNYFFKKNLGLNLEIGYKYFPENKITHFSKHLDSTITYPHQINSFYQSLGIIFRF